MPGRAVLYRAAPCHTELCCAVLGHTVPCCAVLGHTAWSCAIPSRTERSCAVLGHTEWSCAILSHTERSCAVLGRTKWSHAMPCYAVPFHAGPYCVVPCHTEPCRAMPRRTNPVLVPAGRAQLGAAGDLPAEGAEAQEHCQVSAARPCGVRAPPGTRCEVRPSPQAARRPAQRQEADAGLRVLRPGERPARAARGPQPLPCPDAAAAPPGRT